MPRVPRRALSWSEHEQCYEASRHAQLEARIRPPDDAALRTWLGEVTSFAFHGRFGSLNIFQEHRPRGGSYWYAYHTSHGRTRKRYLGQTGSLSLSQFEKIAQDLCQVPKPTPTTALGDREMTLLGSKLAAPRQPNALVARPRLLAALDGALSAPLTLVSASAGWGKTTLLAAWARQHPDHIAWLSLDELDNSPTRFWVGLVGALRRCQGYPQGLGATALALLQSPQPPPLTACLSALLSELESHDEPSTRGAPTDSVVVIVDDYQMISDPAVHESLRFFLEHLPSHLHLILASRVDPDLPLARLRARGQLIEIRMEELRFTVEEAGQFLHQFLTPAQPLADDEVQQLSHRTEGWVAGLQLAALALAKRSDRVVFLQALTGSQRYLLDYVQADILVHLPTDVREFALQTAILSCLDAAVCQAVTAEPDRRVSQQMLEELERINLFVVPLDEERRTYRLHDLFREALLAILRTHHPESVPLLYRRAAAFYEGQEQWHEAITHALAAADYSAAARLMEQTVEQFWLRGEAATMVNWVLALPPPLVYAHARLLLTTALYLLNTVGHPTGAQRARVYQQARQLMTRVETALGPHADDIGYPISASSTDASAAVSPQAVRARAAEEALLYRRLRLLHLYMAFYEATASGNYARLSNMQLEIEAALNQDEEAIWQMIPLACTCDLHYNVGQTEATLLPQLLEAKARVSQTDSRYASIRIRHYLALLAVAAGQLRLAAEVCQDAFDLIEQAEGYALLKGYPELLLAQVLYQWNRLDEAGSRLHTVVQHATAWQHLNLLGWGYTESAQVALARGEWSLAEQALHELEHLVQREHYADYPDWLPTLRAQWWLAQGQLQAASDWAAGVVFPQGAWEYSVYYAFPVVILVSFAQRRWGEALALLERWRDHLDRPANTRITITYLAQLLVALHQTGQRERACEVAARLFALTELEGYLRVYLDEGAPMQQALQSLLNSPSYQQGGGDVLPHRYISRLLAAFEQEQHGASRARETAAHHLTPEPFLASDASARSPRLGATLTRREQEVLRLLATGASNQDIAQTLVISLETVKKHVSNLLGKLGVRSRAQAIVEARARSLL